MIVGGNGFGMCRSGAMQDMVVLKTYCSGGLSGEAIFLCKFAIPAG